MAATSLAQLVTRLGRELETSPRARLRVGGLRGSAPALCLARLLEDRLRPVVVTLAVAAEAEAFAADLRFFLGDGGLAGPLGRRVHYLPAWEVPPFEAISPTRDAVAARAEGFYHLLQTPAPVIVTTAEAWLQRGLPRAAFAEAVTYVVTGESLELETLTARLVEWGYHRVPLVQDPGDVALRGGILDVYPAGYGRPVRIEFLGDSLESLREFDPSSQRSLDRLEDVLLLPMREFGLSRLPPAARAVDTRAAELGLARQERRDLVEAARAGFVLPGTEQLLPYLYEEPGSLVDFLPEETLLWMQGPAEVEVAVEAVWAQVEEHAAAAARDGRFHPPPERLYVRPSAWRATLGDRPCIEAEGLDLLRDDSLRATSYSTESLALRTAPAAEGALPTVACGGP